jgi:hypothetical protein
MGTAMAMVIMATTAIMARRIRTRIEIEHKRLKRLRPEDICIRTL